MSERISVTDYLSKKNKTKTVVIKPCKPNCNVKMNNVVSKSARDKAKKEFMKIKKRTSLQKETLNIVKTPKFSSAENVLKKFL